MVLHPAVARAKIDTCYLDTTYLNPKYCFPPQPQVIDACAILARKTVLGLPETAPLIPEIKPDIKPDLSLDIKPDPAALQEISEERSKALMKGWLVKREDDFKDELLELKIIKPKRTLVVMGTYSIGKERIVKGMFSALGEGAELMIWQLWLGRLVLRSIAIRGSKAYCSARPTRSSMLC